MAWTKAKTAIVASGLALLAAGTMTLAGCSEGKLTRGIPKDWSVLKGDSEQWSWKDGILHAHSTTGETILASGKEYHDVTLSARAGSTNREASLAVRMQDAENGYLIIFAPRGTPRADAGCIVLVKKVSGSEFTLASYRGPVVSSVGQSAKVSVTVHGSVIEVRLNDVRVLRVMDTTFITGLIGLRIYGDADYPCDATFLKMTF